MAKFEIVNDKWVRVKKEERSNIHDNPKSWHLISSLKISSIEKLSSDYLVFDAVKEPEGKYNALEAKTTYRIHLNSAGGELILVYDVSEKAQYEKDLKFFEELLYK